MRVLNKQNYNLLQQLVISDFKIRYQGSVLGYFWSLLKPLALFGVLYVVFAKFFRFGAGIPNFPSYLLLGIVFWTFFTESTNTALRVIVDRGDLIRKINIPKYTLVLSATFSSLINFMLNLVVVALFMVIGGVGITPYILLLPLVAIELYMLSLAAAFLLAALYVRYRDIAYIWEVALQALFYATPIIYPLDIVPERFRDLLLYNPLAQIIQDARFLSVSQKTITSWSRLGAEALVPVALVIILCLVGGFYFKRRSLRFAEDI